MILTQLFPTELNPLTIIYSSLSAVLLYLYKSNSSIETQTKQYPQQDKESMNFIFSPEKNSYRAKHEEVFPNFSPR